MSIKAYRFMLSLITATALAACDSSHILGVILLPDLKSTKDDSVQPILNGVSYFPCAGHCIISIGATGGIGRPELKRSTTEVLAKHDNWEWTGSQLIDPVHGSNSDDFAVLRQIDGRQTEVGNCETVDWSTELPPAAADANCALKRVYDLYHQLDPTFTFSLDIDIFFVPFGVKESRVWLRYSSSGISFRIIQIIDSTGSISLTDLASTAAHETFHSLIRRGIVKSFPTIEEEEHSAYLIGLCAATVVGGKDYRHRWPDNNNSTEPNNDLSRSPSTGSLLNLDLTDSLSGRKQSQDFLRQTGKDDAVEFDASQPEGVKQLFELCKMAVQGRNQR